MPVRKELGVFGDLIGKGATLQLSESNLANEEKRIFIVATRKDGKKQSFLCSPKVSALLRSKEIKLSNLVMFQVTENETKTGEIIAMITMPVMGKTLEFKADDIMKAAAEWKPEEIAHEELIAL